MPSTLPPLLADVRISQKELPRIEAQSRSWMKLSRCIKDLSEEDLLKVLSMEMQGARRYIIISRCLGRYRALREMRENTELFEDAPELRDRITRERSRDR